MNKKSIGVLFLALLVCSLAMPLSAADNFTKPVPAGLVGIGESLDDLMTDVDLDIGDEAPMFSLPNLASDKMESLSDYIGKPIILFFIQSACYSCLQEAVAMQKLYDKYGDKISVIAVGVDLLGKPMLVTWASHNNIKYPVLLDPIFSVPEKYGFSYTPSSVIIDQEGKIAFMHAGYKPNDLQYFEEHIEKLLSKKK
ncbi:MAG: TlpA family protein disulfide reductase [Candidatus Riflebacteria bacterium]|nr:TlpA family protein disulfide reductase [Candidatus Riflebacteria bacterium]